LDFSWICSDQEVFCQGRFIYCLFQRCFRPQCLLLDKPTASLESHSFELIESIVRRLNEKQQTTPVLVTHNVFQAKCLAHWAALLFDGKVTEVSNKDTLFNRTQDPRMSVFVRAEMVY
jgi:ABC-type phosphate transport system ATPase subunit